MFDALGIEIERVSIEPLGHSDGTSLEGHVLLKNASNHVEVVVLGTVAGPIASYKLAGFNGSLETFRTDYMTLKRVYEQSVEESRSFGDFWKDVQQLAGGWVSSILAQYQGPIMRLAKILEQHKTLQGRTLEEALAAAWKASKPNPDEICKDAQKALTAIVGFPKKRPAAAGEDLSNPS
jgi:hypothetical protein